MGIKEVGKKGLAKLEPALASWRQIAVPLAIVGGFCLGDHTAMHLREVPFLAERSTWIGWGSNAIAVGVVCLVLWRSKSKSWNWSQYALSIASCVLVVGLIALVFVHLALEKVDASAKKAVAETGTNASPRPLPGKPDGFKAVSHDVIFIADNQTHYMNGAAFDLQSTRVDQVATAAIRPPVLNVYARPLLRWSLEHLQIYGNGHLVHLGDALDISCRQEFQAFADTLAPTVAGKPWALAPGNHDGYFFGNFEGAIIPGWEDACSAPEGPAGTTTSFRPMNKTQFIEAYVDLLKQTHPTADPACFASSLSVNESCRFYRRIYSHYDSVPRRSFIVQELDISSHEATSLILLDTAAYANQLLIPTPDDPMPLAGMRGELIDDQLQVVRSWIREAGDKRRFILAGHHVFERLSKKSRQQLTDLLHEPNVHQLYVSAHTHIGDYYNHTGGPHGGWLEVNVGSLLDWPQEWLTLQLGRSDGAPVLRSIRTRLQSVWSTPSRFIKSHPPDCRRSKDYGTSYISLSDTSTNSAESYLLIAANVVEAYKHFVDDHDVSDDLKSNVMRRYEQIVSLTGKRDRPSLEAARRIVWELPDADGLLEQAPAARDDILCQAYLASRYDQLRTKPNPLDPWIALPWAGSQHHRATTDSSPGEETNEE